jgi:hypothetical protein
MKRKLFESVGPNRFQLTTEKGYKNPPGTHTFDWTVSLKNGQEVEVLVVYEFVEGQEQIMNPTDIAQPGVPHSVNIISVIDATNNTLEYDESEIDPKDYQNLSDIAMEKYNDSMEDSRY